MHTPDAALPQGGRPGLPGFPIGFLPAYAPKAGLVGLAGRCYVVRGRIAAVALAAAGAGWLAAAAIGGSWTDEGRSGRDGRLAPTVQSPSGQGGDISAADLLDEAEKAAETVSGLAGKSDADSRLVERRLDAARVLVKDRKLAEVRDVASSIRSLGREIEARGKNASLIGGPDASAKTAVARAEEGLAAVSAKVETLGREMAGGSSAGSAVVDDRSASLDVRIADGKDEKSGFWRTSGEDEQYFLIVEASAADGSPYAWKILDADSGAETRAARWAVSVTPQEFARLSSEKAISGKIQDTLAGVKRPGEAAIEWKIAVTGKALAEWKEEAK